MTFDYGIKMENVANVYLKDVNYQVFKNEVKTNNNVTGVSFSNQIPVFGGSGLLKLKTETMEKPRYAYSYSIDPEFINNFGLNLIAGRNFSENYSTDRGEATIINEKAVFAFNLGSSSEAIEKLLITDENEKIRIIGVVKDFNYTFPDSPISPLIFQYKPEEFRVASIIYFPGKKQELKTDLSQIWKKLDEIHPANFNFFDDFLDKSHRDVGGPVRISAWACGFVILISLLGLLGMATYTTETRVKEVAIRKVLGANVHNVTFLLSKDYIKIILYSAIIALPGGYFVSESMMQFFAFRPGLSLWVLPLSLIFILILALITICSQTIKAAISNPVESLRHE